jgi:hypothetical protein
MTNNPGPVVRLIGEQRKRLVASILGAAETAPWWRALTREQQVAFRDKVLTSVGVYHDLCRDVIKISEDDGVRNEYAIDMIEKIYAASVPRAR